MLAGFHVGLALCHALVNEEKKKKKSLKMFLDTQLPTLLCYTSLPEEGGMEVMGNR